MEVAGNLKGPNGLAFAPDGALFVVEQHQISRFDPSGGRKVVMPPCVLPAFRHHGWRYAAFGPGRAALRHGRRALRRLRGEAWRDTLPTNQGHQWNHPSIVKRNYERAMRVASAKAEGTPVKSPMQQLKESLVEVETERDRWRRQAEEAGSLFELRRDTPEQIARVVVENVTPSRAEKIAAAIRAGLKRAKAAHAG